VKAVGLERQNRSTSPGGGAVRRQPWSRRGARFRRICDSEGFVFGWGGLHSGCGGGLTSHDSSPRRSRAVDSGERLVTGESGRGVQETAASSVCFFFPLVFFFVNPGDRWAHSIVVHWIAFNSAVGGGMRVFACRPNYFVFSFNTNLFPVCANKYVQSFQKKSESVKTSDSGEVLVPP
jgi:hypothetical protein